MKEHRRWPLSAKFMYNKTASVFSGQKEVEILWTGAKFADA